MRADRHLPTGSIFNRKVRGIYLVDVAVPALTFVLSAQFVALERALLLALLLGLLAVVAHMKWHLRSAAWFWVLLAIVGTTLLSLIALLPLPHEFRAAAAFAPVLILLGLCLLGLVGAIERKLDRKR